MWQEITDVQNKVEFFNTEQDAGTIGCKHYDLLSIIPRAYWHLDKHLTGA